MPKIMMLTHEFPPFPGGISMYAKELASAASEAGHRVTVYAPSYNKQCEEDDRCNFSFRVIRFKGNIYRPLHLPALIYRTRRILSEENADIFHAVDIPFAMALAYIQKRQDFRFITSVHGAASMSIRDSSAAKILGVSNAYERAERIIANSAFTKKYLLEYFPGVKPENVVIAHLGINGQWFKNVDQNAVTALKSRYGIKPESKIILTVARLDRRKGHKAVFEAIDQLPADITGNLTYVVVGEGDDRNYHKELQALGSQCHAQVLFTGTLSGEDLRAMYASATLFCMPGDIKPPGAEGFGLVYLEAAALGVPSVAFNIAAVPENIRDGETGLLIPHNNIQALAAALVRLIKHPDEARRLGTAAKEWASKFTWSRCAELTYGNPITGQPG